MFTIIVDMIILFGIFFQEIFEDIFNYIFKISKVKIIRKNKISDCLSMEEMIKFNHFGYTIEYDNKDS